LRLPPTIQTERLVLRPPRLEDAPAMFAAWTQDAEVTRYLTWRPHSAVTDTEAFLAEAIAAWSGDTRVPYVIASRERLDVPIGVLEVRFEPRIAASIGYVLQRSEWNRGVMTEAARAVVDQLLALPDLWRVWAYCDVDNVGSARVLAKAGMQHEGTLRRAMLHPNVSAEPRDVHVYARVR
jgi:[ribosomal protein S5]-alanine N-acetyltransferase